MAKLISEREAGLQRKLIPVNIVVCILSLVAMLSLFLAPIIKIDVGKILRDKGVIEFVDDAIDDALSEDIEDSDQSDIDYKPVVTMLVKKVFGKAEGKISISALSSFKVLIAGSDKAQVVLDDLLFGKNALATRLISSVVDGIAEMFTTNEGRDVLEEAIITTISKQIFKSVEDQTIADTVSKNTKELVDIFKELGDPSKVPDGKVDDVAGKFVDRLNELMGGETVISENDRQNFIEEIQSVYDSTSAELKEGETVSVESIICVAISKNMDVSELNFGDLFGDLFNSDDEEDQPAAAAKEELEGEGTEDEGSEGEGTEGEGSGSTEGEGSESEGTEGSGNKIVTTYDDLLYEMGFDKNAKDELKEKMRSTLDDGLNKLIEENGIDTYLEYYQYLFIGMLLFIFPWFVLFLFAFFRLFAKNKRFMMWYVKLLCWIPSIIWLVLTLFPVVASKVSFLSDFWNGDNSAVVHAVFKGISSLTWINGLCYVLLWLVSIFWAFPIKHKIRKERKYPEVEDAEDNEE